MYGELFNHTSKKSSSPSDKTSLSLYFFIHVPPVSNFATNLFTLPVSVLAMLTFLIPVMALVSLLHILDWVKQELHALVDEAVGW